MADRRLVEVEEKRNADGPHWTLIVERSSEGRPGGLVTLRHVDVDGVEQQQMTVVLDDLRRLLPATDWAAGIDAHEREIRQLGRTRIGGSTWRDADRALIARPKLEAEVAVLRGTLELIRQMGETSRYVAGTPLALLAKEALRER